MDVKDFKKCQDAYIVSINKGYMYKGRPVEPSISKTVVKGIGRKYVTTINGRRYKSCKDCYSLAEDTAYGERTCLCPTMEYALMYIEREKLRQWLCRAVNSREKYTLGQLRKVKDILTAVEDK